MAGIVALACAYVMSQFYRSFLAVLTPVLGAELGMTKADFALASGLWFLSFAAMQFAVGVWLDRIGPRRTAALLFGVFASGGGLLFALAQTPMMIVIAMVLIGIGCSPVLMASFFIFARRYQPAQFQTLSSFFIAFGIAGAVLGASPLAFAADAFGWRTVMGALAALTLVIALGIYLLIDDPEVEHHENGAGLGGYLELLRMRALWPIIPLVFFSYSALAGIRGLWAGPYLTSMHGADTALIGQVTLAMSIAMVIATAGIGPLDRLFKSRKWIAFGANILVLAACGALALHPDMSIASATLWLVLIAMAGSNYAVTVAHARGFFPRHLIGRGVTLMNFFSIGGSGVMQFLTGGVVSATASQGPAASYSALFGFYALVLAVAITIYLGSRDAPN